MQIRLSPLDTARFGVASARADAIEAVDEHTLLGFCRANDIAFLIARCSAENIGAAQMLMRIGALPTDILCYFKLRAEQYLAGLARGDRVQIRLAGPADRDQLETLGRDAFRDFVGHYHSDPLLHRDSAAAVYAEWAGGYAARSSCRYGLVAEVEGQIVGIAGLGVVDHEIVEGELFGIATSHRGRGLFSALLDRAVQHVFDSGHSTFQFSTQIQNYSVQRALERRGFLIDRAVYTFHKWFNCS